MSDALPLTTLLSSSAAAGALIEPLREALASGASVHERDRYGLTPLHHAVWKHEPESIALARLLIEAGADVNAVGSAGVPPLHTAIAHNDTAPPRAIEASLALIDLLVQHGAQPAAGATLADFACCRRDVFERLASLQVSAVARDARGDQAIHAVVRSGRPQLVAALLERGVPLDQPGGLGRTPLGLARKLDHHGHRVAHHEEIVALLEARGAPAEVPLVRSADPFAASAVELAGLRGAATEARVGRSIVSGLQHDIASAQELVAVVMDHGDPDKRVAFYELARAYAERRDVVIDGDLELHRPAFIQGDLTVRGHLTLRAPLAVTGNLVVDGVVTDGGNSSWVTVVNDLRCVALYSEGEFAVGGELTCSDVVLGYYNDFTLAAGTIRATLVIEDEHATAAAVEAGLHFDLERYRQGWGDGVSEALRALLVDDVFDTDGQLENAQLFARLRRGAPIYRWPAVDAAPAEALAHRLAWFAGRLEQPEHAGAFAVAIARRELAASDDELSRALAHARTDHDDRHRGYWSAIAAALARA